MKVRALSGYGVKGPACFLLELEGRRLLLDIGEGPDRGTRPDLSGVGPVDAVLLTHAHADHVGALDLLAALGNPPVSATAPVRALANAGHLRSGPDLPLMGGTEIAGLPVLTGRDGHAPGGVWLRIGGERGLLYTGDFSAESVLYPLHPFPRAAALVCDASYGDWDEPLVDGVERIARLAGQGPLLLPAPPGGRGLEIAMLLHARGHRVALCPAHHAMGRRLLAWPGVLREEARAVLAATLDAVTELKPAAPVEGVAIAAGADGETGLAGALLPAWLDHPEATIVFTGHLPAGGPAEALVTSGRARFVRWNVHPRLTDLVALVEAVRPAQVLPAFLPLDRISALKAAMSVNFVQQIT